MPLDNKFHQTPRLERNLRDHSGDSSQKPTFDFIRDSKSGAQDDNSFLTSLEKKRLMQYPIEMRSKDDNQALTRLQRLRLEHMGYLKEPSDHSDSLSQTGTEVGDLHSDSLSQAGTEIGDEDPDIPSSTGKAFSKEDFINDFLNRLQNPEKDVEGVVQGLVEGHNSLEVNLLTDLEAEMARYYSYVDGNVYTLYAEYTQQNAYCGEYTGLLEAAQTRYNQWRVHFREQEYTSEALIGALEPYQEGLDQAVEVLNTYLQARANAEDALHRAIHEAICSDIDRYLLSSQDIAMISPTYLTDYQEFRLARTAWQDAHNAADQASAQWRAQRYTEPQITAALAANGYIRAIVRARQTLETWRRRRESSESQLFRAIQRARQAEG